MPDVSLLETFPTPGAAASSTPGAGRPAGAQHGLVIEHIAEEFTSVCPKTGHPDFGVVTVRFVPAPAGTPAGQHGCVELKSLKMYLQSFRNEGIFYEAVTDRIRDDLVGVMKPVWLQVITNWRGRGGIRSVIRAEFGDVPAEWRGR